MPDERNLAHAIQPAFGCHRKFHLVEGKSRLY